LQLGLPGRQPSNQTGSGDNRGHATC
jgi:hypothetical protein